MPGAARVPRTRGPRAAGGGARGATGDEVQAANPHEPTPPHTVGFCCCSVVEPLFFQCKRVSAFCAARRPIFYVSRRAWRETEPTEAPCPGRHVPCPSHGESEKSRTPATPRPVLRPLGKAQGQRCRTRRHLRRLPRTEHPPQPAGGLRRRILGVVGSTRRRSARRRTECGCSTARSARRAGQQMAPGQRRSKSGFASNFDPEPTGYARTKSIAHPARTPPHRCASAGTPNYPPDKYDAPRQRQRDAPLALMHASSRLTRQRLHALIVGIGHTRMQYVMPAVRR